MMFIIYVINYIGYYGTEYGDQRGGLMVLDKKSAVKDLGLCPNQTREPVSRKFKVMQLRETY